MDVELAAGPAGGTYVTVSSLPAGTTALRLLRYDVYANLMYSDSSFDSNYDISVSALQSGQYALPESWATPAPDAYGHTQYSWWVQAFNASNQPTAGKYLKSVSVYGNFNTAFSSTPFLDGRAQLKQNLSFLVRANDTQNSNSESSYYLAPFKFSPPWNGTSASYPIPTNYVYSGIYDLYETPPNAAINLFRPFDDNYFYLNFIFDSGNLDSYYGSLQTGIAYDKDTGFYVPGELEYQFTPPSSVEAIAPVLSALQSQWIAFPNWVPYLPQSLNAMGFSEPVLGEIKLESGGRGYWGLPTISAALGHYGPETATIQIGQTSPWTTYFTFVYPEAAQPSFQVAGYYFCHPNTDPMPGMPSFSPTNTSPSLVGAVSRKCRLPATPNMP